jgi:hypothetical protein
MQKQRRIKLNAHPLRSGVRIFAIRIPGQVSENDEQSQMKLGGTNQRRIRHKMQAASCMLLWIKKYRVNR